MANATAQHCFTQRAPLSGPPLIQNGRLTLQTHDVGWIVAGIFTIVATVVSFWLISKHLMWYTKKRQQRYIVRLLLMVPVYAIVSLGSYIFWNHAIPITIVRDSYESFVLYSFFYLLLHYLSPTTEGQKEVFRNVMLQKWIFPLGSIKYRPKDGLYFLQLMKWGVLQYCVVRPTTTLAAVILDFIGLYCDNSWSPGWGHIYITIVVSTSVTIAMYCLLQFYVHIAKQLLPHKPLLKLLSVKAVVFLTFWQATGLSALSMFGVVKDTPYMTADDINTGIAAILETFEMMCFAVLHIRAFSYIPYRPCGQKLSDQTPRLRSLMHALDIRDMWREIRDGSVYMGKTIRGVEADEEARRRTHFAQVMGREREFIEAKEESWRIDDYSYDEDLLMNSHVWEGRNRRGVWLDETDDRFAASSEGEVRQKHCKRELSGEYATLHKPAYNEESQGHTRSSSSWWKGIYDRLSQSGIDREREERLSPICQRPSQKHRRHCRELPRVPSLDSLPPPASVTFEYSSLTDGRSSVRLSSSHRQEQSTKIPKRLPDPPIDHNHNSLSRQSARHEKTFSTQAEDLMALRPVSISNSHPIESPVPLKQIRSSEFPRNDHTSNLLASSGNTPSDSFLSRFFFHPTSPTSEEHASSGGRIDPAYSQTTDTLPMASPASPSRTLFEPRSSRRPRGPQKQSPPRRAFSRPPIVLPTPLFQTHCSADEVPRRVSEQSSPPSVVTWGAPFGHFDHVQSPETLTVHRHSDHVGSTSPRKPQAMTVTPMSAPGTGLTTTHNVIPACSRNIHTYSWPQSSTMEDTDTTLARDMRLELPRILPPSTEMRTLPITMTSPISSPSPRQLRHTRGDVGRRPWS